MSIYDKLFVAYMVFGFMSLQAAYQAERFEQHKTISHRFHAWLYAIFSIIVCVPFISSLGWWAALKLGGICALSRLAIFDLFLNWIRDKRPILTYNGKGTTSSWQDQLENLLPTKYLLPLKISYIIIFLGYLILIK